MRVSLNKTQKELFGFIKGKVLVSESLSKYTTFKIGGPADFLVIPKDVEDLRNLIIYVKKNSLPRFILGGGSNLLVKDRGFQGIVIKLDSDYFKFIKFEDGYIRAGSGVLVFQLLSYCLDLGIGGLEFLTGIPGTVGGIISMNAGIKGKNISDVVEEVGIMDEEGNLRSFKEKELDFGYRSFKPSNVIIVEVLFRVFKRSSIDILKDMKKNISHKNKTQDLKFPSAGCIFKNPKDFSLTAAQLIEEIGFKGKRVGDAKISENHANFIINTGNAKAREVISLMNLIIERVRRAYKIKLKQEIVILG